MTSTALIPYVEKKFTYSELLILRAAMLHGDFSMYHRVMYEVAARSLGIPERMIKNSTTNYSGARLDVETWPYRIEV